MARTAQDTKRLMGELTAVAEIYSRPMSEGLLRIYMESLKEYTVDAICVAIKRHVKDPKAGQFFPKPADLLRWLTTDVDAQALEAWTRAERALFGIGQYVSVNFEDPVLHRVIDDMGGWPDWYDWPDKETPFKQKEFCERYVAGRRQGMLGAPAHLPGIVEIDNRGSRFAQFIKPPVLVGARGQQKALMGQTNRSMEGDHGAVRGELGSGATGDRVDPEAPRPLGAGPDILSVDRPEDEADGPGASGQGEESR